MAATPFDTLRNAGFTDEQAEAIVFAIQTALGKNVATKSDVAVSTSDMRTALAEFRSDIYRALWIQGAGIVLATVTILGIIVAIERWLS